MDVERTKLEGTVFGEYAEQVDDEANVGGWLTVEVLVQSAQVVLDRDSRHFVRMKHQGHYLPKSTIYTNI